MANRKDILEILALISVAYPNFKMVSSGEVSTADAYLAFLGDIPSDVLKVAVLKVCSESGRAFAPSVGEIRGAVGMLNQKALGMPSSLEAWQEICRAPKSENYHTLTDEFDERGYSIVDIRSYQWSHPLVEKVAKLLGWPHFPGENEATDRAHFFRQYEAEAARLSEHEIELPEVRRYIETHTPIKQLEKK